VAQQQLRVGVDRNLAMELVRVTEAAAIAASRWVGKGDKIAADGAAVDAMRAFIDTVEMDGVVVIGEGEKDEAPMLYIGEQVGTRSPGAPKVDIAVDPIDGTTLTSKGMPNAVSVIGLSEQGTLYDAHGLFYMSKLAVGSEAASVVDIDASVATNLQQVAKAKGKEVGDLLVCLLDRPRHADLVKEIRAAGARIKFISDGDVAGCIMTCLPETGVDIYLGTGGATECVIAACALKCLGGVMQSKLWPRPDTDDTETAKAKGLDVATQVPRRGDAIETLAPPGHRRHRDREGEGPRRRHRAGHERARQRQRLLLRLHRRDGWRTRPRRPHRGRLRDDRITRHALQDGHPPPYLRPASRRESTALRDDDEREEVTS
jgi:fructose-1,6-bisphosphatase II